MTTAVTLGFALTEHCNLRCPHCIRDDVTTVRSLEVAQILAILDDARAHWSVPLVASFTGGEPLLHGDYAALLTGLAARDIAWRLTTNGWHYRRLAAAIAHYPAALVRVSLSGATRASHDHDRGRGSFDRVLQSLAVLTSRRVPAALSLVIDRRTHHEIPVALELAAQLGVSRLHYIRPQPVPGSVARDSDLAPTDWYAVRDTVHALARQSTTTIVQLDYGAPFDGVETPCDSLTGTRVYVDARGQLSTCCQLSEYGEVETDVIADLSREPLAQALPTMAARHRELTVLQAKRGNATDGLDPFPCMRCARATGKLEWLRAFPGTPWHAAAFGTEAA